LALGYGITNIVERASIGSADLSDEALVRGGKVLRRKLRRFRPQFVGVLGVSAFRVAFGAPEAKVGPYPQDLEGSTVWVLPNPSGLNTHFTPTKLAALFLGFRAAVE
jgi:TDG/mug DNA glycosylase family protein